MSVHCWHPGVMSCRTMTERTPCGPPTIPIALTTEQRLQVEAMLRRGKVEKRVYLRGRALLMMADGMPANRVAWELRVHERTTERWRQRFRQGDPVQMLADAHRSGRPRSLSRTPTAHA
jgi:hypothetical protein